MTTDIAGIELRKQAIEDADYGYFWEMTVAGLSVCLVSVYLNQANIPDTFEQELPPELVARAKIMTFQSPHPNEVLVQMGVDDDALRSEMTQRFWPCFLPAALYESIGLTHEGRDPETQRKILKPKEDTKSEVLTQGDCLKKIGTNEVFCNTFGDYIDSVSKFLAQYLGYNFKVHPILFYEAVETANANNIFVWNPASEWLDAVMTEVIANYTAQDDIDLKSFKADWH